MCGMRKTAGDAPPQFPGQPLYQTLFEVNLHFDHIHEHIEWLRTLPLFRSRAGRAFLPAFDDALSEARAWFNTELLEAQGEIESREWARLDLRRARRERTFREDSLPRPKPKPGSLSRGQSRRGKRP